MTYRLSPTICPSPSLGDYASDPQDLSAPPPPPPPPQQGGGGGGSLDRGGGGGVVSCPASFPFRKEGKEAGHETRGGGGISIIAGRGDSLGSHTLKLSRGVWLARLAGCTIIVHV